MIYGMLHKDVKQITESMYSVTPDLSEFKPLQFLMPNEVDYNAWRVSPGLDLDHNRFLSAYKATLRTRLQDCVTFFLFSAPNEIILISSSTVVLETIEKLVKKINLDEWKGEYVQEDVKKDVPQSELIPLPTNQECMLYEYHAVVQVNNVHSPFYRKQGHIAACCLDQNTEGETWYSALVDIDGKLEKFRNTNLLLVSWDADIVEKRKSLYKSLRPRYYRAGR